MTLAPKQIGNVYTVPTISASGVVTLPNPIETYRMLRFNQTTFGLFYVTLPAPSDTSIHFAIDIVNVGNVSLFVENVFLKNTSMTNYGGFRIVWNGTVWVPVSTTALLSGDQIPDTTAPLTRTDSTALQSADIWFNTDRLDTKVYDSASSSWIDINEPLRVINNRFLTTTRSESFLSNDAGDELELNPTPQDGEHVRIYITASGDCWVDNGSINLVDETGSSLGIGSQSWGGDVYRFVDYIYNATDNNWRVILTYNQNVGRIIGTYTPSTDTWNDTAIGLNRGSLPSGNEYNGALLLISNDGKAADWTAVNIGFSPADYNAGDMLWYDGSVWNLLSGSSRAVLHQIPSGTAPTVRSNGQALVAGDIWINTTTHASSYWNGTAWKTLGLPNLNIVGGWQNSPGPLVTGLNGVPTGLMPAPNSLVAGTAYVTLKNANSTSWGMIGTPFTNTVPVDVIVGDIIYSDGGSYKTIRMNDVLQGAGDTQSGTVAPSRRSTTHSLKTGDFWYDTVSKELKTYGGTAFEPINEPATSVALSPATLTTTKSENFIVTSSAATITLNTNPRAGEKVEFYLDTTANITVLGPLEGGLASLAISGGSVKRVSFVLEPASFKWLYEIVQRTTVAIPSYSEGTFALRPATGNADGDLYRVTGDSEELNGRTYAWDVALASWRELGSDMFASGLLTARPATLLDGFTYYATDTTFSYVYDAANTSWRVVGGPSGVNSGDYSLRPASTTSDSIYLADQSGFFSYYRGKAFFYDQSAAVWKEIGPAASKAYPLNSGGTIAIDNQNVNLLAHTTTGSATATLPTSPEEGQYYRFISSSRTNDLILNAGSKTFNVGGSTFTMTPEMSLVTVVWSIIDNKWFVHVEGSERVTVSATAPSTTNKINGDLWWDSTNFKLYVLNDNGTIKTWKSASPPTSPVQSVTGGVIDCSLGNFFEFTLNGAVTLSFTNPPVTSNAYVATVKVNITSGTLTYPASVKWPSSITPTLTVGKSVFLTFITYNGGTNWFANALTEY